MEEPYSSEQIGTVAFGNDAALQIGRLLHVSKHWLEKAWDNPNALGPTSKIFQRCFIHFQRLQRHQTPPNSKLAVQFRQALRLSWWACWRARDYTHDGLQRNFPGFFSLLSDLGAPRYMDDQDITWFHLLSPRLDRNGGTISIVSPQQAADAYHQLGNRGHDRGGEGYVLPSNELTDIGADAQNWIWSTFDGDIDGKLQEAGLLNCLVEGSIEASPHGPKDKPIENSVIFGNAVVHHNHGSARILDGFRVEGRLIFVNSSSNRTQTWEDCFDRISVRTSIEFKNFEKFGMVNVRSKFCKDISIDSCSKGSFDISNTHDTSPTIVTSRNVSVVSALNKIDAVEISGTGISIDFSDRCLISSIDALSLAGKSNFSVRDSSIIGDAHFRSNDGEISISLEGCEIKGRLNVGPCNISTASLCSAVFCGPVKFHECKFQSRLLAQGTTFEDTAVFSGCGLEFGMDFGPTTDPAFKASSFLDSVYFDGLSDGTGGNKQVLGASVFSDCCFHKDAHFTNRSFLGSTDFDRTAWEGVPLFHGSVLNPDTSFVEAKFTRPTLRRRRDKAGPLAVGDSLMARYERAFRTLKLSMEERRAGHYESMFHKLELQARRLQRVEVSWPERGMSWAYDRLSGYGESFARPLTIWAVTTAVMWPTLTLWSGWRWDVACGYGLKLAASNALRPFYATGASFDRAAQERGSDYWAFVGDLLTSGGPWVQSLLLLHSVFSIVLVFLALVALRRRFQVSG